MAAVTTEQAKATAGFSQGPDSLRSLPLKCKTKETEPRYTLVLIDVSRGTEGRACARAD